MLAGVATIHGTRHPQLDGDVIKENRPAPSVALLDQDQRTFRLTNQRGKAVVLFFGYTHCPDICPTTLAKVATADRLLGTAARNVVVAFVTVDPQRDTTAVLKRFVRLFNPRFFGLTGSPQALDALYAHYYVWHRRLPTHSFGAGYLMAHSSAIFMLDRDGDLRVIHDWSDSPQVLAHDMQMLAS